VQLLGVRGDVPRNEGGERFIVEVLGDDPESRERRRGRADPVPNAPAALGERLSRLIRADAGKHQPHSKERENMGIIAFIILGLLAGGIAKWLMPGDDPGGWIVTALIGVAGALLGGFLAGALFGADPMDEFFDISSWLTAIVGSIILLVIYRLVVDRRGGRALHT
jgi:uncharacterized membrane protein YeaQ/YmgE (transglycosylase-associated protein family)